MIFCWTIGFFLYTMISDCFTSTEFTTCSLVHCCAFATCCGRLRIFDDLLHHFVCVVTCSRSVQRLVLGFAPVECCDNFHDSVGDLGNWDVHDLPRALCVVNVGSCLMGLHDLHRSCRQQSQRSGLRIPVECTSRPCNLSGNCTTHSSCTSSGCVTSSWKYLTMLLMVVFAFSTSSADKRVGIRVLGQIQYTSTMSVMTWLPESVTSKSPKTIFLISCSIKFSVARLVSGVNDHFEHVVGVHLGVLLRNLLLETSCGSRLVPERVLVAKFRRCFVDLRPQRTSSATVYVFNELVPSLRKCLSLVVLFGLPAAFPCGHRCNVGIDRHPPMCLDAQGGINAKRQPFVVGVVVKSCVLGRGRKGVLS